VSDARGSPEIALLLRCGPSDGSRHKDSTRTLVSAVSNWQRVFELASRHAIVPLVDRTLSLAAGDLAPRDVSARFREALQEGALQSLQLSGELVEAMRAFSSAGIDAIPFKGPTLAVLAYGNLSLRQYQDLDVLVHRADVERARTALQGIGYAPVIAYTADQRASLMLTGHHEQIARGNTTVELHWSLNNRTLTHDAFEEHWWDERQSVDIGGMTMRTLGAERLLLYLCMHGGKHSWARLGWLYDLEYALHAYPNADWAAIWRLARENGAERMVGIGLTLVETLLGGEALVTSAKRTRTSDAQVRRISELIARRIRGDQLYDPYLDYRVQVRSRDRLRDRLRYTWHILAAPHPSDVSLLGLPRGLHSLYYILRPMRLVWKNVVRRTVGHL
jgi:hypothetical protein